MQGRDDRRDDSRNSPMKVRVYFPPFLQQTIALSRSLWSSQDRSRLYVLSCGAAEKDGSSLKVQTSR